MFNIKEIRNQKLFFLVGLAVIFYNNKKEKDNIIVLI